jgi:hypothetical protein
MYIMKKLHHKKYSFANILSEKVNKENYRPQLATPGAKVKASWLIEMDYA